ncbi:hypothetical protein PP939_gp104 [Rhizobium phage RL38J1]|uniref:Uncharacterized protein n=1 Tax=Rhizobium phage RL38J1 TaxID=2663232 RepID=A0A6B9J1L1_9CAUD|nr:hypothetical protein PP939_gp104 [Rhizobium phage RL38J1]QGZ14030.1 hypothetical protein RL38J1_104 [Rhizobium phage RL38J1]
MSDPKTEADRFELMKMCISCEHYSSGHNECRRFPPVPVVYQNTRYDIYHNLVEYQDLMWMYPSIQVDHPICGEHVLRPNFR